MKIARDVLERFTNLPTDNRELRLLLDDVGIEVKRVDDTKGPITFTVELLANRGDHHCYQGIAREVTGRTGFDLKSVPVETLDTEVGNWPLERQTDLVLHYSATLLVRDGETGSLSEDDLRVLSAAGIHSIDAPVDATNIANLEIGQPTHVFDADKIDGPIILRVTGAGERAWPLFADEDIELPEGTLVVADRSKILAIAGVIGCEDSKATAESTRLVLESATFDPVAVRKASRALSIFTDASARFERGSDPKRPLVGAGRVVHLLEAIGWRREGPTSLLSTWTDPNRTIQLDAQTTSAFLAVEMDAFDIADRLQRYGFTSEVDGSELTVTVPSWRLWDVEHAADLYEELAKSIGYNATPTQLPMVDMGALPSAAQVARRTVDDVLSGAGFYEVITDGFYGRDILETLGITEGHPLFQHIQTLNAVDRGYSYLKNNTIGQAAKAIAENLAMRVPDVKIYEWTKVFEPTGQPANRHTSPCVEREVLWGIAAGAIAPGSWQNTGGVDGLYLKGILTEMAVELGHTLATETATDADPTTSLLHPGRRVALLIDGERAGILGELHPSICKRLKLKKVRPWYFELNADAVRTPGIRARFVEPGSTHPMERKLAFGLPVPVEADSVGDWLHASGPDWLSSVRITDRFDTKNEADEPIRAITYTLLFDNADQSRSADEVNAALTELIAAVDQQFGSFGVRQR